MPLAYHFIEKYHAQLGYDKAKFSNDAQKKMNGYWWPGNIRELENMIHHALLICQNGIIESNDLSLLSSPEQIRKNQQKIEKKVETEIDPKLKEIFHTIFKNQQNNAYGYVEDQLLRIAYHYCHQNQVKTAQLLGLSRNIIRARLIELGELIITKRGE
jgi:DNA-binding NtrC family response regulator